MARTYGVAHQWDGDLTDPHQSAAWNLRWIAEIVLAYGHAGQDYRVPYLVDIDGEFFIPPESIYGDTRR